MKAIIIGAGAVGFHIAKHMALENKDAVVIDTDADALRRVSDNIDVETVLGSGNSVIQAEILEEKTETIGKTSTYRLRIRAKIKISDFVKAEIEDAKQEKKESKESYQEEMEQPVFADIDPAKDIAKAYRLLREKKWRVAII